jgi:hypothetical protein
LGELQAIRNDLARGNADPDLLKRRTDAVGRWAATQKKQTPALRKVLEEAHSLVDRIGGGSGKHGMRIEGTAQAPPRGGAAEELANEFRGIFEGASKMTPEQIGQHLSRLDTLSKPQLVAAADGMGYRGGASMSASALRTALKQRLEMVRGAATRASRVYPASDQPTLAKAFAAHAGARHNLVSLADLKDATGWSTQRLHNAISDLQRRGILTLTGIEGRHGITPREREAAIAEGQGLLGFASVRDEAADEFRRLQS